MSNVLTNSASIPYGTWGGVTRSSVTTKVDNPYTISNLQYNCKVNTGIYDNSYVFNMVNYAKNNIPSYTTITSIPSGHLPTDINTSLAQNWRGAFISCNKLTTLPDPFYDTSNATDMTSMFYMCNYLKSIPNFNTSNVTNMDGMFYRCNRLTTVSDFDTSNVTNMDHMFAYCYNLINTPNINTSKVTNMYEMFRSCNSLTTVPNFNTSNVTNMYGMFSNCSYLKSIPNFNTINVTNMANMFCNCSRINVISFNSTNNVTNMANMFRNCCFYNFTISNFNTINVTNMANMFHDCSNLTTVPNFDTSNVTDMANMFRNCSSLTTIPNFDTSNVTNMDGMFSMFYQGFNLTTIPIFNTSKVTSMYYMFDGCSNLQGNLYIESNNVSTADYLFGAYYDDHNFITNIYCHANTQTYNTIYNVLGNATYNSDWNTYLYTMEDNYAEIPWTDNGIYRFPTNKVMVEYQAGDGPIGPIVNMIIEVSPYTDYSLSVGPAITVPGNRLMHGDNKIWSDDILSDANSIIFRFFKDITNMTPDIVDPGITIQGLQDPNSEIYVNNKKYNSNPFYCEFEGEQLLEIYSPNYLSISQEINIPKNTSITVDVEQNRNDAIKVTIIPSISGANITYKYGTMTNYGTANDDGTFYVPKNTDIEYIVKLTGYKTVTNTINISEDTTVNITLEMATYKDINITTPFTDNTEYLTNLADNNNFEISGNYIQSGSSSYHKDNGTSYGYIQFTTPGEAYIDSPIEIECYVSSENNYDYAAVYIGTQVYEPSRTQIKNKTTDGNGEFIFAASGNGSLNTYTYSNLLPNTTYYLSFAYAKDSSSNSNSDRFFIKSIKFRVAE